MSSFNGGVRKDGRLDSLSVSHTLTVNNLEASVITPPVGGLLYNGPLMFANDVSGAVIGHVVFDGDTSRDVSNVTLDTAKDIVLLSRQAGAGTYGHLSYDYNSGTSTMTIHSSVSESSVVVYMIIYGTVSLA